MDAQTARQLAPQRILLAILLLVGCLTCLFLILPSEAL